MHLRVIPPPTKERPGLFTKLGGLINFVLVSGIVGMVASRSFNTRRF